MSLVLEGILESKDDHPSQDTLMLTSSGQVYQDQVKVKTPSKFYFFEIESSQMYLVNRSRKTVELVNNLEQIEGTQGKTYFRITVQRSSDRDYRRDHKVDQKHCWLPVDLTKGVLPEITVESISSDQSYYNLNISPSSFAYPLNSSQYRDLSKGRIWVGGLTRTQILSYLLVDLHPNGFIQTRSLHIILQPESVPIKSMKAIEAKIQAMEKNLQELSQSHQTIPEKTLPLVSLTSLASIDTLGVKTNQIYLADHYGDITLTIPGLTKLTQPAQTNTLVLLKEELLEEGLRLTFRQRFSGNKGLPDGISTIPSDHLEVFTRYHLKEKVIYRERRKIHSESYREVLVLTGSDQNGSIVIQPIQIEYGALLDKQIGITLDFTWADLSDDHLDITDPLLQQLNGWFQEDTLKDLSIDYLSHPRGFDSTTDSSKIILKTLSTPPRGEPFTMIRQIMIKGTIRPIILTVQIRS